MQKGTIVVNLLKGAWGQFIDKINDTQSIFYDGQDNYVVENEDLVPLKLPVGLTALGFTDVTPINKWPKVYQNKIGLQVEEREVAQFFVENYHITYTHQIQEEYGLFNLLPKEEIRFL